MASHPEFADQSLTFPVQQMDVCHRLAHGWNQFLGHFVPEEADSRVLHAASFAAGAASHPVRLFRSHQSPGSVSRTSVPPV